MATVPPAELTAEIVTLMESNLDFADADGKPVAVTPEKAAAVALLFVQRESQKAAQRSRGNLILGVASQLQMGSLANSDVSPYSAVEAVAAAQELIDAVEERHGS